MEGAKEEMKVTKEAKEEVKVTKEAKAEVKVTEEAKGEVKVTEEAKGEVKVKKEAKGEVKIAVPIKDFWKAMPTNYLYLAPKLSPDFVKEVELVEGENGHVGSVIKYIFQPNIPYGTHQTEKLIVVDESLHQLVFKVVEGGALNHGFSSYEGCFKLSEISEKETRAEMIVTYEKDEEDTLLPEQSVQGGLLYFKVLENHLLNHVS